MPSRLPALRTTTLLFRGQNSCATFAPACAARVKPAEANPAPTVLAAAGCQAREIKPLPTAPDIRPDATVFFPVVVFCVTTVLTSACSRRGPNPVLVDR